MVLKLLNIDIIKDVVLKLLKYIVNKQLITRVALECFKLYKKFDKCEVLTIKHMVLLKILRLFCRVDAESHMDDSNWNTVFDLNLYGL